MSQLTPLRYQFDPTGASQANLIVEEQHNTGPQTGPLIVLNEGMFYTRNFVLRTSDDAAPLERGTDYEFVSFDPFLAAQTGLEVAGAIQLLDDHADTHYVTYQCVGGYEGRSNQLVLDLIEAIEQTREGGIDWYTIRNKPTQYPPAYHTTELRSITGWEALINKLHELRQAILDTHSLGSSALTLQRQDERILFLITQLRQDLNWLLQSNAELQQLVEIMGEDIEALKRKDVELSELIDGITNSLNALLERQNAIAANVDTLNQEVDRLDDVDNELRLLIEGLRTDVDAVVETNRVLVEVVDDIKNRLNNLHQFDFDFGVIGEDRSDPNYDTVLVSVIDAGVLGP
jgi:prefoldin subunit 5